VPLSIAQRRVRPQEKTCGTNIAEPCSVAPAIAANGAQCFTTGCYGGSDDRQ